MNLHSIQPDETALLHEYLRDRFRDYSFEVTHRGRVYVDYWPTRNPENRRSMAAGSVGTYMREARDWQASSRRRHPS